MIPSNDYVISCSLSVMFVSDKNFIKKKFKYHVMFLSRALSLLLHFVAFFVVVGPSGTSSAIGS